MSASDASAIEARRHLLRGSQDPRPERTRQAIVDAVVELGRSGRRSITVTEIARSAGVGRSSFYTHFASLDRLAEEVFLQAADQVTVPTPQTIAPAHRRAAWRRAHANLVQHSSENRALYVAVLALPVSHDVHIAAVRLLARAIQTWIEHLPHIPDGLHPRATSTYLGAATIGLMSEWFYDRNIGTEQQLLDTLMNLAPEWLFDGE